MKHLIPIALVLLLALIAPVSQVGAESPPPGAAPALLVKTPGRFPAPQILESSNNNSFVARLKFPMAVTARQNTYITTRYSSVVDVSGGMSGSAPNVRSRLMRSGPGYLHGQWVAHEKSQMSEPGSLDSTATPAAGDGAFTERPKEENVASLAAGAHVVGVSSNLNDGDNSSEFGALKAIDGLDDTEWASDGDGNHAWIEIGLAREYNINAVGFRSRKTSDGSGQVTGFTVTTDQGETAGPFRLPGGDRIYYFRVQLTAHTLRFSTVETSGGDAGAVAIEAFGTPAH